MALAVLAVPAVLQSCHDDKDIVVIDEELPLKVDHLYMVGDATPAGWSIDNPAELVRDASNKFVFTYHGRLAAGELKFPLARATGGRPSSMLEANTEINSKGVAESGISVRRGGDDTKWKVTESGTYLLTINLRERTIQAVYEGAEPVTPITTSTLGFIGDATPAGWSTTEATTSRRPPTAPCSSPMRVH